MERFTAVTLGEMLEDKETMDFSQMFEKYMPVLSQSYSASFYMERQDLENKIRATKEGDVVITDKEWKELFNKTLFLAMPQELMERSEVMSLFEDLATENGKEDFSDYINLYHELKTIRINNDEDFQKFSDVSNKEVQIRIMNDCMMTYYGDYIERASTDALDFVFFQQYKRDPSEIFSYPFPSEIYLKNEDLIEDCLSTALKEKIDLVDEIGGKETLNRCSNQIFRRIPDREQADYVEQVSKAELEVIKEENLDWKDVQEVLSGNELLEILDSGHFEPEDGKVYHLNFETPYLDFNKLFELAEKYKLSCSFTVRSCAEFPMEVLAFIESMGIHIESVKFKADGLNEEQEVPYDIETYKKCLAVIDIMTSDAEEAAGVKQDDPDREKKIAGLLLKRFTELTSYNHDYIERSKRGKATEEEDIVNRNLVGALLNGTCVCAGKAEAVRNLFLCAGIKEVEYVSARNKNPKEDGHAWNQAKLDGEWTNIDVTWDESKIKRRLEPEFCFKSDREFGHEEYVPRKKTYKCEKSLGNASAYMGYRRIELNKRMKDLVRFGVKNCRIGWGEVKNYEKTRIAAKGKEDFQK